MPGLDELVGVDELHLELPRQLRPNRGLPGPHESGEDEILLGAHDHKVTERPLSGSSPLPDTLRSLALPLTPHRDLL